MSEAFEQVIARAVKDESFRNLLLSDPEKALEAYQVTDEERTLLENMDEEELDKFAGGLGDRSTKGSWIHGAG